MPIKKKKKTHKNTMINKQKNKNVYIYNIPIHIRIHITQAWIYFIYCVVFQCVFDVNTLRTCAQYIFYAIRKNM